MILDDVMAECEKDKRHIYFFAKGCRHLNVSVIFVTQNLFHKGSKIRGASLSTANNRNTNKSDIFLGGGILNHAVDEATTSRFKVDKDVS